MIEKIKSELLPLTRELAQQFKDLKPVPGERPMRHSRLNFFQVQLRQQTFNSPNWAKAIIEGTGEEYRADGQHTSNLLATCDESLFPQGLSVTVSTYLLTSTEDLAQLFDLFDNPRSARSNADKLGIYIAEYPELAQVDRTFLNKIAHGIDYHYRDLVSAGHQGVRVFPQREHGLYFSAAAHREFALWLYPLREAKHAWMFSKPGITAEIYADWQGHRELAERFWREVMTESNPDVEDETRELATTLRDWAKKQPRVKQDKFRHYAKKIFDRYRRTHTVAEVELSVSALPAALLPGMQIEETGAAPAA
jgi:hypothetical protein